MAFGLTAEGFKEKRLVDVQAETTADFEGAFGVGFDLDPRTPEGQLKGILDERISKLWQLALALSGIASPSKSIGAQFDSILALTGNKRRDSISSVVLSGRARGTFGTPIPLGTIISVAGDPLSRFVSNVDETISVAGISEIQKTAFDADPDSGDLKLKIFGETTIDLAFDVLPATVEAALEALPSVGVGNIGVAGSVTQATGLTYTFKGTLADQNITDQIEVVDNNLLDGATPVGDTPSVFTEGDLPKTPLMELTEEEPRPEGQAPAVANAGTLSVIETPVTGMDEFTNEEDAIVGALTEKDAAGKARRSSELQIAGAATPNAIRSDIAAVDDVTAVVLFQNRDAVTDLDGRPPHSVEIVVQGADDQDIADAEFDTVAAGIGMVGDEEEVVIDSEGFPQPVRFNRPADINIFVEVDIVKDPNFYPTDGDAQVKAAVLAYGDSLEIGEDVVVFGSDPSLSCSFKDIPGITGFTIRVGKAADPTLNLNIPIAADEIADFDSSRIIIVS